MTAENQYYSGISRGEDRPSKSFFYRNFFKRPLDILLVVLSSPFVVPVIIVFAAMIMLDGGNPFYSQERVGRKGKTYRIWKLRSMVKNAEQRLDAYLAEDPAAAMEWASTQKLRDDPRVTGIGRFLRRSSMDELPQLWNVLKGEMSLVGPRPMMTSQRDFYAGTAYYSLRPGITGFWQVSDRNGTTFSARAIYDDVYDRNLSFLNDVSIMFRTVWVVLRATGC